MLQLKLKLILSGLFLQPTYRKACITWNTSFADFSMQGLPFLVIHWAARECEMICIAVTVLHFQLNNESHTVLVFCILTLYLRVALLSDSGWFYWLWELVFHSAVLVVPTNLCVLWALAASVLYPLISYSDFCCCQKWQIWQNVTIWHFWFIGTHALRLDTQYLWENWGFRNSETSKRALNYRWKAIWLLHRS